jgi:hypothetical protein
LQYNKGILQRKIPFTNTEWKKTEVILKSDYIITDIKLMARLENDELKIYYYNTTNISTINRRFLEEAIP